MGERRGPGDPPPSEYVCVRRRAAVPKSAQDILLLLNHRVGSEDPETPSEAVRVAPGALPTPQTTLQGPYRLTSLSPRSLVPDLVSVGYRRAISQILPAGTALPRSRDGGTPSFRRRGPARSHVSGAQRVGGRGLRAAEVLRPRGQHLLRPRGARWGAPIPPPRGTGRRKGRPYAPRCLGSCCRREHTLCRWVPGINHPTMMLPKVFCIHGDSFFLLLALEL